MIWYFMSIASYLWRRVSLILREQSRTIKYQPYENGRELPSREKTVSYTDETEFLQKHHKKPHHRVAQRSMSFAAGVSGYGQSIAILTSGGDSQGLLLFHLTSIFKIFLPFSTKNHKRGTSGVNFCSFNALA